MDTRRLLTAVLLTFAIVFLYQFGITAIGKKLGYDMSPRKIDQPTTHPSSTQPTSLSAGPGTQPTTTGAANSGSSVSEPALRAAPALAPGVETVLGSATPNDPAYRMAVKIVPTGAGVESVVLNQFKRTADGPDRYVFARPYAGAEDLTRTLATRAISIDGAPVDLHNAIWSVEPSLSTASRVAYTTTIVNDAGPVVRLVRTYEVLPPSDPSGGYELVSQLSWANLTDRAVALKTTFNGPTTPPREIDRGPDRYIIAGYFDKEAPGDPISVAHHAVEEFVKDSTVQNITTSQKYNLPLEWAGSSSTYFNAIVRALPTEGQSTPTYIEKVQAFALNPDSTIEDRHVGMTFETSEVKLEPGQSGSHTLRVFFGPKQRQILKDSYYSQPSIAYNKTLVITGGLCGICTFQWLIDLLVLMLRGFHWLFGGFAGHGDWGLAIIGLVAVVRLMLHPITKKSQVSMMKMQKMGPEMEKLRQKYKDDKEGLSKAMWELQKEQGIGAYLGCLPMFLQMPIWIALWSALNSTFELRQAPFLWGFTWIHDLSKPDNLIALKQPINIFFLHITGLNVLPLLLAVVFYFQMKLQPKPATMTKEQEQQQKIMMWMMPVLFPIMLYSGPSGLNLYILASTFTGIIESKVIRKHIKEREEAEKDGRVIVDAGKKLGGGKKRPQDKNDQQKRGGIIGFLAGLQERAENMRRDADRRGKDKA